MKKLIILLLLLPSLVFAESLGQGKGHRIVSGDAGEVALEVKAAASQTANIQSWTDSDSNAIAQVQGNGRMWTGAGLKSDALKYGGSLMLWTNAGPVFDHTGLTGSYDYTGGAYEELFTCTTASFTQDDADTKNWIIIKSGEFKGAMAEILTFISTTQVVLHTMAWAEDITSVTFDIMEHPMAIIGDGHHIEWRINGTGHFGITSVDWLGSNYTNNMLDFELDAATNSLRNIYSMTNANGYSDIYGARVRLTTGDIAANEINYGMSVSIDETGAASADSTTLLPAYEANTTNVSDATTQAFVARVGFVEAMRVYGAEAEDPDYGYEITSGSVVDRVNSGGGGNDAFITSGTNVEIFDSNADYILIGNDAKFEVINYIAAVPSSKDIIETYEYSTGNDTWSTLTTIAEGTNGFTRSGGILFNAPGDWAVGNQAEGAADITSAYYIKITRTFATNISVLPTESYFKIADSRDVGMRIMGSGAIELPKITADPCGDAARYPEGSVFYNDTSNYPCYCDDGGNDLKFSDNGACF